MFGLFTRPTRRPRNTRRTNLRPTLRVEALEARANPDANPTLSNVSAVWTSATQVVVSGIVTDMTAGSNTPAQTSVMVGGAAAPVTVPTNAQGAFTATINVASAGTVLIAATPITATAPVPVTVLAAGQPALSNVTITQDDGVWHIKGQVTGGSPIGTIITIISSDPSINGEVNVVTNPDGTFDIGVTPSVGGTISITIGDGDGNIFDQWSGIIA